MKKLIEITAVFFIFASVIFTSCEKQEVSNYSVLQSKEDIMSLPDSRIVKKVENYTEEETNLKGTLYVVKISDNKTQEFFILDENQVLSKKWILYQRGRLTYHDFLETGGESYYDCSGDGVANCYVLFNRIHMF